MRALLLLSLGVFGGCGSVPPSNYDLGPCGLTGERCCVGDVCQSGEMCVAGFCQAVPCGNLGDRCCSGMCNEALVCVDDGCQLQCGYIGAPCCPGRLCSDPSTACSTGNVCQVRLRPTGAPCSSDGDCDGFEAFCYIGVPFPSGYCSSHCYPSHSDLQTGLNPDCPGGIGVCENGGGDTGVCMAGCTAASGTTPCRAGYACFDWCYLQRPCAHVCGFAQNSQCDPMTAGSCGAGMACFQEGPDNVGSCGKPCDLLAQDCDQSIVTTGCYVFDDTGQGFCEATSGNAGGDGAACQQNSDCTIGATCLREGDGFHCRPFCGGPKNLPCVNGKQCVDFSTTVKLAVVGVCAG